ncbi:MAG: 16S rRNA (uracil(1498)-N(3))-methyltransferase [Phycisphaerales bacterium]|nr:16S rRNA (uracil(1498)-N(3))-methyltransferase [Phycisphaerales bacterium]
MQERRFKVETVTGSTIIMSGRETVHAVRVLRLNVRDEVVLFDGQGREVDGRIRTVSSSGVEVEVTSEVRLRPIARSALILAVATPKGPRADWLVEKCAELGVHRLCWLTTRRGIVEPGEGKLSRWRRKAVAAAKQAGQARVMDIEAPRTIMELADAVPEKVTVFYGDPDPVGPEGVSHESEVSRSFSEAMVSHASGGVCNALVLIGPEGGFTVDERECILGLGGKPVRLAGSILRIETAAIAAAAIWACTVLSAGAD